MNAEYWSPDSSDPAPSTDEMLEQVNAIAKQLRMSVSLSAKVDDSGDPYEGIAIGVYADFDETTGRMITGGDWIVVPNNDEYVAVTLSRLCWLMTHVRDLSRAVDPDHSGRVAEATTNIAFWTRIIGFGTLLGAVGAWLAAWLSSGF